MRRWPARLLRVRAGQPKGQTWYIDRQNLQTALTCDAWVLWCLGYPDQALKHSQQALALAQELGQPFHPTYALSVGGAEQHVLRRELQAAQDSVEAFAQLGVDRGFALYEAIGAFCRGRLQVEAGATSKGLQRMRGALQDVRATGTRPCRAGAEHCS